MEEEFRTFGKLLFGECSNDLSSKNDLSVKLTWRSLYPQPNFLNVKWPSRHAWTGDWIHVVAIGYALIGRFHDL